MLFSYFSKCLLPKLVFVGTIPVVLIPIQLIDALISAC